MRDYTGTATYPVAVSFIDDSDGPGGTSFSVGPEGLADRTEYLRTTTNTFSAASIDHWDLLQAELEDLDSRLDNVETFTANISVATFTLSGATYTDIVSGTISTTLPVGTPIELWGRTYAKSESTHVGSANARLVISDPGGTIFQELDVRSNAYEDYAPITFMGVHVMTTASTFNVTLQGNGAALERLFIAAGSQIFARVIKRA